VSPHLHGQPRRWLAVGGRYHVATTQRRDAVLVHGGAAAGGLVVVCVRTVGRHARAGGVESVMRSPGGDVRRTVAA